MSKYISWILITTGFIIILIAIYQEISTIYNQKKLIKEYNDHVNTLKSMEISEIEANTLVNANIASESNVDSHKEIKVEPLSETKTQENDEDENNALLEINEQTTNLESTEPKRPNIKKILENKEITGLLEIPKLNVTSAILEGTDDSALQYAVGHYPGLGQPGEGNYVLLGHRNYVYGHFFRNLDELEVGDKVIIIKDSETYSYVIYESFVVKPEEVWVLEQTSDAIVTMITCTPIGTYTDRLIVRGALE